MFLVYAPLEMLAASNIVFFSLRFKRGATVDILDLFKNKCGDKGGYIKTRIVSNIYPGK